MKQIRKLAERIAEELFKSGDPRSPIVDRLVLVDDKNKDLGGWGRGPATDQIEKVLKEYFARKAKR